MISEPTVFILGAGASNPYGFPIGSELKYKASKMVNENKGGIFGNLGYTKEIREDFCNALIKSDKASVDSFLEHRTEFIDIGKLAIAASLVPLENEGSLYADGYNYRSVIIDPWYRYIFSKMNTTFNEFSENQVSFITYNYDRSLEHYLITSLQNSYGKSIDECARKICSLTIIHLHGNLGFLPWQTNSISSNTRPYKGELDMDNAKLAASQIKIIHEDVVNNTEFILAKEAIKKANRLYFLGFGYDRTNLTRLLSTINLDGKAISGTALGLTALERREVTNRYHITLNVGESNITNFFRQYVSLV